MLKVFYSGYMRVAYKNNYEKDPAVCEVGVVGS